MEKRICPRCNKEYEGYPALSRKDNKTEICPECGMKEAFEDYFGNTYEGIIYWDDEDESELKEVYW